MTARPIATSDAIAHWLFPGAVVLRELAIADASLEVLVPEDRLRIAGAVPHRQREFAAGRVCAAAGLEALGLAGRHVSAGEGRAPRWPEGIVGSISHDTDLAIVVAGRSTVWRSLGIDVERPHQVAASLRSIVCRDDEPTGPDPTDVDQLGIVFSAKESVFKCYSPVEHAFLDFHDIALDWTSAASGCGAFAIRSFSVEKASPFAMSIRGRWMMADGRIYTSAFVAA